MSDTATQRKYVMTKLREGDYLLPSNDAKTVWRISRYDDPDASPAYGWQVHKLSADRLQQLMNSYSDPWDWEHWHYWGGGYGSRSNAVDDLLNAR